MVGFLVDKGKFFRDMVLVLSFGASGRKRIACPPFGRKGCFLWYVGVGARSYGSCGAKGIEEYLGVWIGILLN